MPARGGSRRRMQSVTYSREDRGFSGTLRHKVDADFRPLAFSDSGEAEGEVVFAGYGLSVPEGTTEDAALQQRTTTST